MRDERYAAGIEELLATGRRHLDSGGLATAEQIFQQVLQADPENADVLNMLGVVARKSGQFDLAMSYISKAIALRPLDAAYHANKGLIYRSLDRLEEAVECYRQILRLKPAYAPAHNNFGVILSDAGRIEEAVTSFRTALTIAPNFEEARRNLACASEKLTLQARFRDNLRLLHDVLEETAFQRKYFVFGGLLLGWAREGRILPHDYFDADFGFLSEHRHLLLETVSLLTDAGFQFGTQWPKQNWFIFHKDGAVFEFYEMNRQSDGLQYSVIGDDRAGDFWDVTYWIPVDELEPMDFLDRTWLKPRNHDALLTTCYGNWHVPNRNYNCTTDDKSIIDRRRCHKLPWMSYSDG